MTWLIRLGQHVELDEIGLESIVIVLTIFIVFH